jgi:hypothetical protein
MTYLLSILAFVLFAHTLPAQANLASEEDTAAIEAFFSTQKENLRAKSAGTKKAPHPPTEKFVLSSSKSFQSISQIAQAHSHLLEAVQIAQSSKLDLETYLMASLIWEQLGIDRPLTALNFVTNKFALAELELNQTFNNNVRWQNNRKSFLGRKYEFTLMDKQMLYLQYMNEQADVASTAMKNIFKNENPKLITQLLKISGNYHFTGMELKHNTATKPRIDAMLANSQKKSIFNQDLYLSYLSRAFGQDNVANWQNQQILPSIDELAGQIALTIAITTLFGGNSAQEIAAYQGVLSDVDAAAQMQRMQPNVNKGLRTFYAAHLKSKK